MRIFVTGGMGYIGSVLTKKLLKEKIKVRCYDSLVFGEEVMHSFLDNENFEFIRGDITNHKRIAGYMYDCDMVIHLAALVFTGGEKLRNKIINVNYNATRNIVDICKNMGLKLIFTSTCSNYGETNELATEHSSLRATNAYAESKIKAESYILNNYSEATILRLSTAFGLSPRMRFDLLINEMTLDATMKKKVTIYNPEAWRPALHVDDIVDAIVLCIKNKVRGVYNVGHESLNYQKKQLYDSLRTYNIMLEKEEINTTNDPRDYRVSFEKIKKDLNFKPRRTIEYGVFEIMKAIQKGQIKNPYDIRYRNLEVYENVK